MDNVYVKEDFALLDLGQEVENPFTIIEGVNVGSDGSLVDKDLAGRVLSNEAVKNGATRINESDCVDMESEESLESFNDNIVVFNGGDIYSPYDGKWARSSVADWEPEERDRALAYITHRENRYDFLVANSMFLPTQEAHTVDTMKEIKEELSV